MVKANIRLTVTGDKYSLEVYETEPGKLIFSMNSNDPEDHYGGGYVETETSTFIELLQKLVSR